MQQLLNELLDLGVEVQLIKEDGVIIFMAFGAINGRGVAWSNEVHDNLDEVLREAKEYFSFHAFVPKGIN